MSFSENINNSPAHRIQNHQAQNPSPSYVGSGQRVENLYLRVRAQLPHGSASSNRLASAHVQAQTAAGLSSTSTKTNAAALRWQGSLRKAGPAVFNPGDFRSIETKVDTLIDLFKQRIQISRQIEEHFGDDQGDYLEKRLEDVERRITQKQKNLVAEVNRQCGQGRTLKSFPFDLVFANTDIPAEEELEYLNFIRNVCISKLKNLRSYTIRTAAFLEGKKDWILENFLGRTGNFKNVKMQLKSLGAETHNKGEYAILVSFVENGVELGKVVYKPRTAETEIAAMEMFHQINALGADKTGPDLPTYKIIPVGENGSLWEYIEGSHPPITASRAVEGIEDEGVRIRAEANLARLQNICKRAGIVDLHGQNTLIKRDQVIPVDMEVVKSDARTGLYYLNEPDLIALSEQEEEIIQHFVGEQSARLARLVPLATHIFMEAAIQGHVDMDLVDQVIDNLPESELLVNRRTLQAQLHADFARGDIPFFTIRGDTIYYGIGRLPIAQVIGG